MVLIPFGLTYVPMTKLALINFEKSPDSVYKGLEPQYFNDEKHGNGYRIIAYRNDGYVDVYDDINLKRFDDESFDVVGKGLCEKKMVTIEDVIFEKKGYCFHLSFKFTDKHGRLIVANIKEQSTRKSNGINLLAPVGSSSEKPTYLPLFFLYDFDFVRKHSTVVELTIDGKKIEQDNFLAPFPKDFQWRYFTRYTLDCQIVEFATAKKSVLEECVLDKSGVVGRGPLEYQYRDTTLVKIKLKDAKHPLTVEFDQGLADIRNLDDNKEHIDTFKITADKGAGFVSGKYSIIKDANSVVIEMTPSDGWTPETNSILTKILFTKKSLFCSWPKTYKYIQKIDLDTLESDAYWERIN
ncbi:hypothetical protein [Desulfuribacillus alkaliarsenatis]|uniref:Uncharacterized protein n=1 Tax=Desulfuribacillus alkaliarsenatis TaxID=766136 RepID=A0A1E5FYM6_9FIRM|nr:hypothetical protein [Desulfuribacillus alkaliarsenatis]OEF95675.1 hypothetical protein BHF68_11250 [Desulfuribacillus alkaliarsenatis]